MSRIYQNFRQSNSARAAVIGLLVLILLIPLAMVGGVIEDRRSTHDQATYEIMRSWGRAQVVGGPILVIPYRRVVERANEEQYEVSGYVRILPDEVAMDFELTPRVLNRGLHEIPVYTATASIRGEFAPPDVLGLGVDDALFDWDRAHVLLPVEDPKAIRNAPAFVTDDGSSRFEAGGQRIANLPLQISAPVSRYADESARRQPMSFSIEMDISGTDSLNVIALGESTQVNIRSSWASPSFSGAYLPERREVTDAGFSASWRISNLGRNLPSRWTAANLDVGDANLNAFGVALFVPVDLYHATERARKYGILFIGLTFVCYFLFEVIGGLRLHPLQYLLVGFANTLFFLLLLSLAEHVGFGWSYLVSAIGSSGLIVGYSVAILETRARALLMLLVLGLLYAFLYVTLKAESYAMLSGSIGLWLVLGTIMYLTRRVDWYRQRAD